MDGLKRYVIDDRFRVDRDKNMRLLAFAFTIVFVWTGPQVCKKLRRWLFFYQETERFLPIIGGKCHTSDWNLRV